MDSTEYSLTVSPRVSWDAAAYDEELLHATKAGSHKAFTKLQNTYSRRLYKCILAITRNHEDAEDALQEAFISISEPAVLRRKIQSLNVVDKNRHKFCADDHS